MGVPPYSIYELCVLRNERDRPNDTALIDEAGELSFAGLRHEVERRAMPIALAAGEARRAVVSGVTTRENLLVLLAGLAAGVRMRIASPGVDVDAEAARVGGLNAAAVVPGEAVPISHATGLDPAVPAVTIDGRAAVNHSNRSLLAMAISMMTFLDPSERRPWLSLVPLSRWEGLMAALMPLYLGLPLILPSRQTDPESVLAPIGRYHPAHVVADLVPFGEACREAKRAAKDARGILNGALLAVDGPFDSDARRRVSKSLECPALTFWGRPETGPVFASHASWYIDESVGLPMTNAHVVPSDPRTGLPIQALWELVESAEVTVFSPSLMTGYDGDVAAAAFAGTRFRTGMSASSDANGMIYLLGET
jgi:acyl-coenzyme A synthetase/AMP-(fatty) acid ligase